MAAAPEQIDEPMIDDVSEADGEPTSVVLWLRLASKVLGALAVTFLPTFAVQEQEAIARTLRDPLSIFSSRSPGERGEGALTQTKSAKSRILAASRVPPSPTQGMALLPEGLPSIEGPGLGEVGQGGGQSGPLADAFGPSGGGSSGGGGIAGGPGSSAGSGGGGGGGGGFPGAEPPVLTTPSAPEAPVPVTFPVPEPASWITMIAGFMILGAFLRRRHMHTTVHERRDHSTLA